MVDQSNNRMEMASRIRELRESIGVSVEEAARQIELGLEEYLEYESGQRDVPVSVLYNIAGNFGVDLTDLMTGKSPNLHRYCVVRDGKGPEIERFPGYRFQSLAFDFQNRHFEPLLVTLDPAMNPTISPVKHGGQEFNFVLSGRVRVVLGGKEIDLARGDSLFFDPAIPHGQLALDDAPAVFLTVIMHDHVGHNDGKEEGPAC